MPLAGVLCASDLWGGWPSVFYIFGKQLNLLNNPYRKIPVITSYNFELPVLGLHCGDNFFFFFFCGGGGGSLTGEKHCVEKFIV